MRQQALNELLLFNTTHHLAMSHLIYETLKQ